MKDFRVTYTRDPRHTGRHADSPSAGSITKTKVVSARHSAAAAEIVLRRDGVEWEDVTELSAVAR